MRLEYEETRRFATCLLRMGTGLGRPAQAVFCFAAHATQSGMPFSVNHLEPRRGSHAGLLKHADLHQFGE